MILFGPEWLAACWPAPYLPWRGSYGFLTPEAATDVTNRVVWRWDSDPFGVRLPEEDPDGDGVRFSYNLRLIEEELAVPRSRAKKTDRLVADLRIDGEDLSYLFVPELERRLALKINVNEVTYMDTQTSDLRQWIFSLAIQDKNALYDAYMPFIKNGGLFIPTTKSYTLGEEVFMLLRLMDSQEKLPVTGRVAWITPVGAHGNKKSGIGVQFSEHDKGATRARIETLLAGTSKAGRHTQTM